MRGKANALDPVTISSRITPAYAGKRFIFLSASFGIGDHPRLCGEKKVYPKDSEIILGSPPPMRGKGKSG